MQIIKDSQLKWIKDKESWIQMSLFVALTLIVITNHWKYIYSISVDTNYFNALREDFWNYLYFFHLKPPGLLIKDKVLQLLFPLGTIGVVNFYFLIVLNIGGSFLFSLSLRWLRIPLFIRIFLSCLILYLSFIFIFWRYGLHYDHYNIFSHLFVIFSWVHYLKERDLKSKIILAFSLGLNISIYSPGILLLPLSALLLSIFNWRDLKYLFFPLIVFSSIILKNYFAHSLIAPSSLSGSTRLTNAFYFYDGYKGLARHVDKNKYPEWWKSCFHYAAKNHDPFVGSLYGTCFFKDGKKGYDFEHLKNTLNISKDSKLYKTVQRDKDLNQTFPGIFAGPVPEFALGFSVQYGKVASKVWADIVKTAPKLFLDFSRNTFSHYTLDRGSDFFSGESYEPKYMPLKFPLPSTIRYFFKGHHYLLLVLPIILFPLLIFKFRERNQSRSFKLTMVSLGCWSAFLSFTGIFSLLVCCENDRMYASLFPYLLMMGAVSLKLLLVWKENHFNLKFSQVDA